MLSSIFSRHVLAHLIRLCSFVASFVCFVDKIISNSSSFLSHTHRHLCLGTQLCGNIYVPQPTYLPHIYWISHLLLSTHQYLSSAFSVFDFSVTLLECVLKSGRGVGWKAIYIRQHKDGHVLYWSLVNGHWSFGHWSLCNIITTLIIIIINTSNNRRELE